MFKATATINYDPRSQAADRKGFQFWWIKASTPASIMHYYRYWVERELGVRLNTALWGSHVTVCRGEEPKKKFLWKKYEGKKIEFFYSPEVRMSQTYAWIPVESPELEAIRVELGLRPQPRVNFHLTLGNTKNLAAPKKEVVVPFKTFPWEDVKVVDKLWRKQ